LTRDILSRPLRPPRRKPRAAPPIPERQAQALALLALGLVDSSQLDQARRTSAQLVIEGGWGISCLSS
jgi:hypothetical protein